MKIMLVLNGMMLGWYMYDLLQYIFKKDKKGILIAIAGIVVSLLWIWSWF